MNFTRFLLLVLVLLFIVGCATNDKPPAETKKPEGETAETETGPIIYKADYLPDADYGGYEFRIVAVVPDSLSTMHTYFEVEKETGDIVDDAIFARNRIIEEKYNVKFIQIDLPNYGGLLPLFTKNVLSSSDDFDLCMMISMFAWDEALKGTIVPVKDLPYLDINQPWYVQEVNRQKTIAGKTLLAFSDECLNMLEQTVCVMFNKGLKTDFDLEDMYKLVEDNKWTVDKFFEMVSVVPADLNGDGVMTETDRYGIVSTFDFFYSTCWIGSGISAIEKDADDLLVYNRNPEKLYGLLDKLYRNIHEGPKVFFEAHVDKAPSFGNMDKYDIPVQQFANNQGLFGVLTLSSVQGLRGMETDFGILPFPKYDEKQEKYYSNVLDGWINCVPITNTDFEMTSVIMEALAVESRNLVLPAYLETALRTKYSRDDESLEMLNIIEQGRTVDFGLHIIVRTPLVNQGIAVQKNNFASQVEKDRNKIDKLLSDYNEAALLLD
ncbi:MAG: hypothetical protein FWF15_01345 [Oscillospiraceae bacterium]|nr:hypothetical protein [Oscillospiraceae bacterium]